MKSLTKLLLVGAVAVMAMSVSVAPSDAAKRAKRMAAPAPCQPGLLCASNCSGGACKVNVCGLDGKLYQALFTPVCFGAASGPVCPPACR